MSRVAETLRRHKQGASVHQQLHHAIADCADRGLLFAARWLAQLLVSAETDKRAPFIDYTQHVKDSNSVAWRSQQQFDCYLLAKQYFDLREFQRCTHLLQRDLYNEHPKSLFLYYYARFLEGEKQKEEKLSHSLCETQNPTMNNHELIPIKDALQELKIVNDSVVNDDGYLLYLLGLAQARLGEVQDARDTLLLSIKKCPLNWSAWIELSRLMTSDDIFNATRISIDKHWMADFFLLHTLTEGNFLLQPQAAVDPDKVIARLDTRFPRQCAHLDSYRAQIAYLERDLSHAIDIFGDMLVKDPFRLDSMDVYANALYVNEDGARLSFLAHNAVLIDRYRPETNVIIGNHMSKKGDHNKAVQYFRRALRLNRSYATAWTLLGHEYLELIQPEAAAQSYRVAVEINPRDYRPWYGLGQVYHFLNMYPYACEYLQRALAINPLDSRMWYLLGQCYLSLNNYPDALRSFKRSIAAVNKSALAFVIDTPTNISASSAAPKSTSGRRSRPRPSDGSVPRLRSSSSGLSETRDTYAVVPIESSKSPTTTPVQHNPNAWASVGLIYAHHLKDRERAKVYLERAWELRNSGQRQDYVYQQPQESVAAVVKETDVDNDSRSEVDTNNVAGDAAAMANSIQQSIADSSNTIALKRDLLVKCAIFLATDCIRSGDVLNANEYLSGAIRHGDASEQATVREIQDAVTRLVERQGKGTGGEDAMEGQEVWDRGGDGEQDEDDQSMQMDDDFV